MENERGRNTDSAEYQRGPLLAQSGDKRIAQPRPTANSPEN